MWSLLFQWQFVFHRLGLALINRHTKFEFFVFTRYEDMTWPCPFQEEFVFCAWDQSARQIWGL